MIRVKNHVFGRKIIKSVRLFDSKRFLQNSSFNIDTVINKYETRTEFAAANYRKNGDLYRMVLPPPNVTGRLHLGHALTVAIEDAICRHRRAQGDKVEWIPGFDHAGIATQAVVERNLLKQGKRRQDFSRTEFINLCHKWSESSSDQIKDQLSRMGASLDWSQSYYTLDKHFSKAVTDTFCSLYSEGLIYRGERIVHWCPKLESTLSSQEIVRTELPNDGILTIGDKKVQFGKMHRVRYAIVDSTDFLEVGTTRPETLFADVALAVHPNDSRYSQFIGKYVKSPVLPDTLLPVISDELVKMDKGTGVVKITPSHDPLDYEIWKNNSHSFETKEIPTCVDIDGTMINCPKDFEKLNRFDAREKVVEHLKEIGSYGGILPHKNGFVNLCSRTGDVIEPRLAEQWFLECGQMFDESIDSIKQGKVKVYPEYQEHRLLDWFENREPWCLSRQLLWGHRIPAYKASGSSDWVVCSSIEKAKQLIGQENIVQHNDVLDTWFSSSLVPLIKNDYDNNKIINLMETGWDISGFWVARMIALNIRLSNGKVPFPTVLLHGLVRDSKGRKMSKSLGNVIDPLDVLNGKPLEEMIQRLESSSLPDNEIGSAIADLKKRFPGGIERCGPDALRFALLKYDVLASDIPLDVTGFAREGLRFCNKIWNLCAYYEKVAEKCSTMKDIDTESYVDEWIMARLATTVYQIDEHMRNYSLHLALSTLHKFITNDICDVYLETTKDALWNENSQRIEQVRTTLQRVLQPTLVQLSIFMPFISEYLYEKIFSREFGSVNFDVVKPSLFVFYKNEDIEKSMRIVTSIMAEMRSLRQKLQLPMKIKFEGVLEIHSELNETIYNLSKDVSSISQLYLKNVLPKIDKQMQNDSIGIPVPGHDAKLWIRIDNDSKPMFIECLQKQLNDMKKREKLYLEKYETYIKLSQKDERKNAIEKNRRKAENSRKVAHNAREESIRIEKLLKLQS